MTFSLQKRHFAISHTQKERPAPFLLNGPFIKPNGKFRTAGTAIGNLDGSVLVTDNHSAQG